MTFFPTVDNRKFFSSSSIPLLYDINIGLVVDDVLDSTILQNTYALLIGGSPVLGGVLRCKKDTRKFHCGSTVDFEARIVDYDLASFLPFPWYGSSTSAGNPTILHDNLATADSRFLFNASCNPRPVCKLRATILRDASLLCFSFVHGLFDAESGFAVIRAFCGLLSGEVIAGFGLPPDVDGVRMSDLVSVPTPTPAPAPAPADEGGKSPREVERGLFVTSRVGLLKARGSLFCTKLFEALGFTEKITHRLVHISSGWVDEVRRKAQKELESAARTTQLSNLDIVTALHLKMFYRLRPPSRKPVDLISPLNYRAFLETPGLGTGAGDFTHNSAIFMRCQLSELQVQRESIARVAEEIRKATLAYSNPVVIKRELRFIEDRVVAPAIPKGRGSLKWGVPVVTSWTTFDYKSLDFSGACHSERKPSVVFVNPDYSLIGGTLRNPFLVTVKDASGGYWLRAGNTASGWEEFEHCTSLKTLFCAIDK
ncbi:hypothetical protein BJX70DRAFT_77379 [Aspergillus crustosus]